MGRTMERVRLDFERILRPARVEGKDQNKQNGMAGNCRLDRLAKALAVAPSPASAAFSWQPAGSTRSAAGNHRNPRGIGSTLRCAVAIRQSPVELDPSGNHRSVKGTIAP